jgi:transcriptional regulator with XRE-family HTH domain
MYNTRSESGRNNICGCNIRFIRLSIKPKVSQRKLADIMQLHGLNMDKNVIRRIENGERFVTDIELKAFSKVLGVSYEILIDGEHS